jgi:hypothetical protein
MNLIDTTYLGSDIDPHYTNSDCQVQSRYDGSITSTESEASLSRRAKDTLVRNKWILKSLDLGIKREFTRWWNKNYVRQERPCGALESLDNFHDPFENMEGAELNEHIAKTPDSIPKISGKIARLCRMEHLVPIHPTVAEITCYREWIVRHMNERNIRKSIQSAILPYALKYTLIPTRDEISARELVLQPEYQQRLQDQQPLYSRERPWLFNWLGRKVQEPVVRSK